MPSRLRKWVRWSARPASTTPGTPTTALPIRSRGGPVASISDAVTALDRGERRLALRAGELDVLPDADVAGEVADCAAGEARAEVEAEHERGVGDGLEEDGAEARAVRVVLGLAHEPGLEQRLQRERDGRLRDPDAARDLGARDRRLGAQGLEHGALVQVLEQRRSCAGSGVSRHLVRNPNGKRPLCRFLTRSMRLFDSRS